MADGDDMDDRALVGRMMDMSQIGPGCFLGNAAAAIDQDLLTKAGIGVVINVAGDLAAAGHAELEALYSTASAWDGARSAGASAARLSLALPDDPSADYDLLAVLLPKLPQLLELLAEGAKRSREEGRAPAGGVLVHCVSGRNRSATVLAACVMAQAHCTARAAVRWLQFCRPIVKPCDQYQRALQTFEQQLASEGDPLSDRVPMLLPRAALTSTSKGSLVELPMPEPEFEASMKFEQRQDEALLKGGEQGEQKRPCCVLV